MKKSLFASAALSAIASISYAQESSVTLYGVLDAAFATQQVTVASGAATFPSTLNVMSTPTNTAYTGNFAGMINGGISDSRWGLKGSEDLGGGRKASFTLESGLDVTSGQLNNGAATLAANSGATKNTVSASDASALNGQLFNRGAFVSLSDETLGTIQMGRTTNPYLDVYNNYDPVQASQILSPFGYSGKFGGGGLTENSRLDNSLKYASNTGPFKYVAAYKFGNVAGSNAGNGYSITAGYETAQYGVMATYQNFTDTAHGGASSTAGQVTSQFYDSTSWGVVGKYKITPEATVKAGYQTYHLATPSNPGVDATNTSYYGATVAGTPTTSAVDQTVNVYFVGGDYFITPKLNLAAGYYNLQFGGNNGGASYTENMASVLLDYNLSKRTDVYTGFLYNTYSGDAITSAMSTSNNIFMVGMRHKF